MSETDKNAVWNTAVTRIEPNRVAVRGYDIADLMGRASFGAAVHLILTGELPAPPVARLMDAVLVASIGVTGDKAQAKTDLEDKTLEIADQLAALAAKSERSADESETAKKSGANWPRRRSNMAVWRRKPDCIKQ